MRQKTLIALGAGLAMLALDVPGAGAADYPWNIPANVRVVQKDSTNARIFTTVQAAINSCAPTATATNHCLVKVMPGTYSESVQMAQYVDVEGSGDAETTVITASVQNDVGYESPWDYGTTAVVRMASNTELRNVKVVNSVNTGARGGVAVRATDAVNTRATDVTAIAEGACTSGNNCGYGGIIVRGVGASATLTRVRAIARNLGPDQNGDIAGIVSQYGASVTVVDSSTYVSGGNYEASILCHAINAPANGSLKITGSVLEMAADTTGGQLAEVDSVGSSCDLGISDSILRPLSCSNLPETVRGPATVRNSELWSCKCDSYNGSDLMNTKVSSSLIQRPVPGCGYAHNTKLVNCWDQNFDPIPNQ